MEQSPQQSRKKGRTAGQSSPISRKRPMSQESQNQSSIAFLKRFRLESFIPVLYSTTLNGDFKFMNRSGKFFRGFTISKQDYLQ